MPARIGPKRPHRIFLVEWREKRGLTQKQLAERLGVSAMAVSRWERSEHLLNTGVMAAVAEALGIEPSALYRHPDQPSADELLRDAPESIVARAIAYIQGLKDTGT